MNEDTHSAPPSRNAREGKMVLYALSHRGRRLLDATVEVPVEASS